MLISPEKPSPVPSEVILATMPSSSGDTLSSIGPNLPRKASTKCCATGISALIIPAILPAHSTA